MSSARVTARDDFDDRTKRKIAVRSGHRCAICGCATDGPTLDPNDAHSIGDAAHITAAASGGPRYDETLSPEQRKSPENGLWACKNCHSSVDGDESRYTVPELRVRKGAIERQADELRGIRTDRGPELAAAVRASRAATQRILAEWRTTFHFAQAEAIELDYREIQSDSADAPSWTVAQIAAALGQSRKLVIVGAPGAGKTVTLIQVADRLLANTDGPIPLLISVNAWVSANQDLANYIAARLVGLGVASAGVPLLFASGRLAVLLNGWNEAPDTEQSRAAGQLRDFLLNNPNTALAITGRAARSQPAVVGGSFLFVNPLVPSKQASIVRAAGLAEPDALLQEIDRNPVLAEVTQTPLFLAAAISVVRAGRPIPSTRGGLLETFVSVLEASDNHAEELRTGPCQDFHHRYLAAVAAAMTRAGATTLSSTSARNALAACSAELVAANQLGSPAPTPAIAESLVRHHSLVIPPDNGMSYAFVHQQFQEWFASRWLMHEIRALWSNPEAAKAFAFQRDILNLPSWQEALGFAMESLMVAGDAEAAAHLVRWMTPVDLISAADLCGIGGADVWVLVHAEMGRTLRAWHALGGPHRRCALAAMGATGASDFADLFWPMLEDSEQSLLRACRLHRPFRTATLGLDWADRVQRWPERREALFLSELSREAGPIELEYAEARARTGSLAVRVAALLLLVEQGAYARALAILSASNFPNWPEEIYERVLHKMPVAILAPHLDLLFRKFDGTDSLRVRQGTIGVLRRINHDRWIELAEAEIDMALAALRTEGVPFRPPGGERSASISREIIAVYVDMLWGPRGSWVAEWLVANLGDNLLWEEPFSRRIELFPEEVRLALTRRLLASAGRLRSEAIRVLLGSGSAPVADILIEAYLTAWANRRTPAAERRHDELRHALRENGPLLVDAILRRAAISTDYQELKELYSVISPMSALDGSLGENVGPQQREPLRQLIRRISELIPDDEEVRGIRPSLAVTLGSLGASEDVALICTWCGEENERWSDHLRRMEEARAARPMRRTFNYGTSWWSWYGGALSLFRCPESEAELVRWLDQPPLSAAGANGLLHMSLLDGSLPRLPERFPGRRAPEATRPLGEIGAAVRPRADAIARALEQREALPTDNPEREWHLVEMTAALGLLNDPRAVVRLFAFTHARAGWTVLGAFSSMQLRGAVLPGRRLAEALEQFIAENEVPTHSSNDQWHGVVMALKLLLGSDEPQLALERMRRLPRQRLESYHVRDIFALLSASSDPNAAALLVEFSRSLPMSGGGYEDLIEALGASSDLACHMRLLENLRTATEQLSASALGALEVAAVAVGSRDPTFRAGLREIVRDGALRCAMLPRIASNVATEDMLDPMLDQTDLGSLEADLRHFLDNLSEDHQPVGMTQGHSYYVIPAEVTGPKRHLAAKLTDGGRNAEVAARLLAFLRAKRLDYGQPPQEPFHPNIDLLRTGAAFWPVAMG